MNFLFRLLAPLCIIGIGAGLAYTFVALRKASDVREDTTDRRPLVNTVRILPQLEGIDIETDGVVYPYKEIEIAAQVSGRIIEKAEQCRAGRFVREGMLLMVIDQTDYRLMREQVESDLQLVESQLSEKASDITSMKELIDLAKSELAIHQKEEARNNELQSQNVISASEWDQKRRALLTSQTALVQLQKQLDSLENQKESLEISKKRAQILLERAKIDLQRTEIRSPVAGIVVEDPVEKDSFVSMGKLLVKIEDITTAEVRTLLKSSDLALLWDHSPESHDQPEMRRPISVEQKPFLPDNSQIERLNNLENVASPNSEADSLENLQKNSLNDSLNNTQDDSHFPKVPATVTYKIPPLEFQWNGFLDRYDGSGLNNQTRMFPCRIVIPEPHKANESRVPTLLRGMYVSVSLHMEPNAGFMKVPVAAIQPGNRLFIIEENRSNNEVKFNLQIVSVQVVKYYDDFVLIRDDSGRVRAGMEIVVSPLGHVAEAMEVRKE
ncbi:MAG: efflux RND transporter periplasmic adaptor subunit [Thermoguttaceae bacterium]